MVYDGSGANGDPLLLHQVIASPVPLNAVHILVYLRVATGTKTLRMTLNVAALTDVALTTEWQRFQVTETIVNGNLQLFGFYLAANDHSAASIYLWDAELHVQ
jgi:hypothetical protein